MSLVLSKKLSALTIFFAGLFMSLSLVATALAATQDSSISLKKDPSSGLFVLTVRDPDGIQEFSLKPVRGSSYGGGLGSCPRTFTSDNVAVFTDLSFDPAMPAFVIDCNNNTTELEIGALKNGFTSSSIVKKETPVTESVDAATTPTSTKQEEKEEDESSLGNVTFPVPELGNCKSENDCRSYCDNADHAKECLTFAKKHNLISEEEAEEAADKFLNVKNGPGGCDSWSSCESYCSSIDRLDECISFAEKSGHSNEKIAEAKKIQALVKSGKQFPGGCKDRNSCELYCADVTHMEECIAFAEDAGFMPEEELRQAKKILPLMKRGEMPGGCTSKEQCEKYCEAETHFEECIAFAEKADLLSGEEKEMLRKTGGKGPGGCKGKKQCEAYCETNSEACFNWAKENGVLKEEDLAKMREGMTRFRDELDKMPPEVVSCLKQNMGEENFTKMSSGEPVFDRSLEGKMKSCFGAITKQVSSQLHSLPPEAAECIKNTIGEDGLSKLQSGEFDPTTTDFGSLETCFQKIQESFGGPGGLGGPGGCKSKEECQAYCESNQEECKGFSPSGGGGFSGGGSGGFSGPGGCHSIDECTAYCEGNPEKCQNFGPSGGGGFPGGPDGGFPGDGATREQFPGGGATGGGFPGGPGGCTSQEECRVYCEKNPRECQGFTPPGGGPAYQNESQIRHDGGAEECAKRGGKFDGSTCVFPERSIDGRNTSICPSMPTVDSCPSGQEKVVTFKSSECGEYYGCKPASNTEVTNPSSGYEQQYKEEYQRQYEEQYKLQYQPQYQPPPAPYPDSGTYQPPTTAPQEGETRLYQAPEGSLGANVRAILSGLAHK